MTIEEIVTHFEGVKKCANGYKAKCPCHDDKQASLSIIPGDKKTVISCFAGCNYNDIIQAVGLRKQDIYYEDRPLQNRIPKYQYYLEQREKKKVEALYHYRFLCNGAYAFTKVRFEGKVITYGVIENDRFNSGLPKSRKEMKCYYGSSLDDIKKAIGEGKPVYIPEGEKDCDNLLKRGLTAFTYGGSQDWDSYFIPLATGADVVILSDNDEPGRKVSEQIKKDISEVVSSVVIVTPSDKDKGDISDFFEEGHTVKDLEKLIQEAKQGTLIDKMQFVRLNSHGEVSCVSDEKIFKYVKANYNLFVCGSTPFIYHKGYYRADYSGAELKTIIRDLIPDDYNLIKSTTINRIYDLFIMDKGLHKTYDELNNYPSSWICFKNGMYDSKNKVIKNHDPDYLCINQIPSVYIPDTFTEGKQIDSYLDFITEAPDEKEMLLQFIGLCMTKDTGQQKFLVLNGIGGSGKSTLIRLIENIVGSENISNVSLADLQQRFAVSGLANKILNSCADLSIDALEDTSILKKLLGEDSLRAELKGKDAFSFKSYAKLIFSTNELPLIKSEKTNGFYRRLLILTMNKAPVTVNPNFYDELQTEINYLIELSVKALERLYSNGLITVAESSKEAVKRLRQDSDTVAAFIDNECDISNPDALVDRVRLYNAYENYCKELDRQPHTKINFYKSLRVKGFTESRSKSCRYFGGISIGKSDTKVDTKSDTNGFIQADNNVLPFR